MPTAISVRRTEPEQVADGRELESLTEGGDHVREGAGGLRPAQLEKDDGAGLHRADTRSTISADVGPPSVIAFQSTGSTSPQD